MNRGICVLALLAPSLAACHRQQKPSPADGFAARPATVPSDEAIKSQIDEALRLLIAVRGLEPKHTITSRVVDANDYRLRLTKYTAATFAGDDAAVSTLWQALNFADVGLTPGGVASRITDDAQNDAFYDAANDTLYFKRPTRSDFDARDDTAVIMSLERAVQVQNFGGIKSLGVDIDANLARLALREGDASAASIAYFAKRSGKPLADAIERAAGVLDSLPVDALITSVGYASALGTAPYLVRDELTRARAAGLRLVAALVRARGFELVDRALANPPPNMLAVYDPQLYVGGWRPDTFAETASQDGVHATAVGTLGVVGVVAFMERCEPTDRAKFYAPSWRGDSFSLYPRAGQPPAFLWRIAWKDEETAQRFADDVVGAAQCRAPGTMAAAHFEASRKGTITALTNDASAVSLSRALRARVAASRASAPPLGDASLKLPVPSRLRFAARFPIDVRKTGALKGSLYSNVKLGFESQIPTGFETLTDEILAIDHPPPSLASGRVMFEQTSAPFDSPEDFFASVAARIGQTFFRGASLNEAGVGQRDTRFGSASFRRYEMHSGRAASIQVFALPICGGRAALVVVQVFMNEDGKALLETWLRSFKPLPNPTVCAALATTEP